MSLRRGFHRGCGPPRFAWTRLARAGLAAVALAAGFSACGLAGSGTNGEDVEGGSSPKHDATVDTSPAPRPPPPTRDAGTDSLSMPDPKEAGADATGDAKDADAAEAACAFHCGTGCVTDCSMCPGAANRCGTTCVTSCTACPKQPFACGTECEATCERCGPTRFGCNDTASCMTDCTGCVGARVECVVCPDGGSVDAGWFGQCSTPTGPCNGGVYPHCACQDSTGCVAPNQVCSGQHLCEACGENGTDTTQCAGGLCCKAAQATCSPGGGGC